MLWCDGTLFFRGSERGYNLRQGGGLDIGMIRNLSAGAEFLGNGGTAGRARREQESPRATNGKGIGRS